MNRKALTRQYKETRRPAGVFRVRNTTNGKSFVGASTDVASMLNRLRFQLGHGLTLMPALQADWDRLGPDAFEFEVLDTLEPQADRPNQDLSDDLRELERLWLEKLCPFGDCGYNPPPRQQK
jgi:hypothetical protein